MLIRLAKNGEPIERPTVLDAAWFFLGDSNHSFPPVSEVAQTVTSTFGSANVRSLILPNTDGRAATLKIEVDGVHTLIDGYHFARMAFDALNVRVTARTGVPLVEAAMLLTAPSPAGIEVAARFRIPFPDVKFAVTPDVSPIYSLLLTLYSEGIRTNSPLYAFLLYFQLAEFLLGKWQGAIRAVAAKYNVTVPDITAELSGNEMDIIAPYQKGKRYVDVVKTYRDTFRNAVAHFDLEFGGPKPFLSRAEDEAAVARDVLRVACDHLLDTTTRRSKRSMTPAAIGPKWRIVS